MDKTTFLHLKGLFEQYQAHENAIQQLDKSKQLLKKHSRILDHGMFKVELGYYRTQLDSSSGTNTEPIKPIVLELIERLIGFHQERLDNLDDTIERI